MKKIYALLMLFLCLSTEYIFAQAKPHVAAAPDSLTNLASVVTAIQIVKLNESQSSYAADFNKDAKSGSTKNSIVAYPNTIIHFTISNPTTFLKTRPNDRAKVVFYANGIELKGISAPWESAINDMMLTTGKIPDLGQTADIYIQLKRNDTTQQAWNFLYANKPGFWDNFANVDASIGWEGMSSLKKDSKVPNVNIIFYYNKTLVAWLVLFVALLGGFAYLCFDTNTLHQGDKSKAFSLSLTQLMFWTILVIAAFIYTVILTDIPTSLNSSILIMLGISMGTTGTATLIDTRFKQNNQDVSKPTKGFLQDLLTSDGQVYSVQRIQVFAWNLVLGLYFITYTIANKSMPVFSSTLLFLAGISSASYVGTKVPENNDLKTQAAAQNSADNNAVTNKDNSNNVGASNPTVAPNNVLNGQTTNNGAVPDNKINAIADQSLAQDNSSNTQAPTNGVTVIIPQAIIPETPQVIDTNPQITNNGAPQNSNTATAVQETQQNVDPEINQETHQSNAQQTALQETQQNTNSDPEINQIIPQDNGQQITTQETQQNTNPETNQDSNQPAAVQETQQNTNLNAEMASQEAPQENVQQITTQETQENTNPTPEIINQQVPQDNAQQITIQETQQNDNPNPQIINDEPVSNQGNINEPTTPLDNTSTPTPPPVAVG